MTDNMKKAMIAIPAVLIAVIGIGCSGAGSGGISPSASRVAAPVITPESGEITNTTEIIISAEDGATVYYTLDGSDPTFESERYAGAFTLPADVVSQTVKAFAVIEGLADSETAFEDYLVNEGTSPVTFADPSGALPDNREIVLSASAAGATIFYTVDGSDPTVDSDVYSAPFTMAALGLEAITVKAFASLDGYADSPVASAEYAKAVAETPASDRIEGETISDSMTVALTSGTLGASIYYTADGLEPTSASNLYAGPFSLPVGSAVVKAIAVLDGYADSAIHTLSLTVEAQAEVPAVSEASGFLAAGSTVELSTTSGLETIYYTLDGSDPAVSDTKIQYAGAIVVDEAATLRAFAAGDGYYPSAEARAYYVTYGIVDSLTGDASALAAIAGDGSLAIRANGSYHDLVSGSLAERILTADESYGDVLDFVLGESGEISALYLFGTDLFYWTSGAGAAAKVNTAEVSLADARILIDSAGSARIVFAQFLDAVADEVVEAVYDSNGGLIGTSVYALNSRATGLDAVLDSSDRLSVAVSDEKNGLDETAVVARDEGAADWTVVKGWTYKVSAPALAVRSDDSLVLGYVNTINSTKNRFVVHDIAAAADLISINGADTAIAGDTNMALASDGSIYAATGGSGWRIENASAMELGMGTAPYRILSDPSGSGKTYVITAADLSVFAID